MEYQHGNFNRAQNVPEAAARLRTGAIGGESNFKASIEFTVIDID